MRLVWFGRLIAAGGLGASLGAAAAGLVAILSGQALTAGSPWLTGAPLLAVLGLGVGAVSAYCSRGWFVPHLPRRTALFTAGGGVLCPLAIAVGQLHSMANLGVLLVAVGAGTTATLYWRTRRRMSPPPGGQPARPVAR